MSTRRDIWRRMAAAIEPLYGPAEAGRIARIVVTDRTGIGEAALLADPLAELHLEQEAALTEELRRGRPVQYVLGRTDFCGLTLRVREGCLIPRPETEELVDRIVRSGIRPRTVLDIGTGSGCIALALKRAFPEAAVTAIDRSDEALAIARENAAANGLEVAFRQLDILAAAAAGIEGGPWELIVSNPPYIPLSERASMRINVTAYEPAQALFVPDADPLCFYRAIGRTARTALAAGGSLWFEVHETLGEACRELLRAEGFPHTELFTDFLGKPRMLWSRR